MKAIMLMFDTLSRHFLSNYGNQWVDTPNFQRLAEKCTTFENFYAGSMPCIPARREIHTGRYNFLHRGWGPLEPFDFSVIEALGERGIHTHLVTDHVHYLEDGGATYHNRYDSWEIFRGQENDKWVPSTLSLKNQNKSILNKSKDSSSMIQYYANLRKNNLEEDMPTVKTINAGLEFLENHRDKDNWFLHIECFDPHEPFYVPEKYRKMYTDKSRDEVPFWPAYQYIRDRNNVEHEIIDMQNEYAALISMCDEHLGKVLDYMDQNDMWADTMLIVNTDHGFLLGEHDMVGKSFTPMYEEVIHTPFFIHVPDLETAGQTCVELAQTIDIAPTLMDFFNLDKAIDMDGKSLINLLKEPNISNHSQLLFGIHGGYTNIFDGRYVYMRAAVNDDNSPLVDYTLMTMEMKGFYPEESLKEIELCEGNRFTNGKPCLKVPLKKTINYTRQGHLLFDLHEDPNQVNPIHDKTLEDKMCQKLIAFMERIDAPNEEFERLGLT